MSQGHLSIILHAHLPFIRHADEPGPRRDDWFLEALVESYVPLLQSWHGLLKERVPFRITLSISPTLLSMFTDPFLRERARGHFDSLIELACEETIRTRSNPALHSVARMYADRFARERRFFVEEWNCDLVACLRPLMDAARVEVVTTAATHGFLPALRSSANAVRAQIRVALDLYEKTFGARPAGFWLPECGYYPGLDEELESHGIRYFIVDSQALLKGRPSPKYGVNAPAYCRSGVAAFARDPAASEQVWSSKIGYPGDHDYREYYRDIGYELDAAYLAPYLPADGSRKDTGLKYHRVTGPTEHKDVYVREWAMSKAGLHSGHFLDERIEQVRRLAGAWDRQPIIIAPFDAELFGHWWFEGPEWLDFLIRKTAFDQDVVTLSTPSDYMDRYPMNQVIELCPSTWGRDGHNQVWVNGNNDYVYRRLHWAGNRIGEVAGSPCSDQTLRGRARKQLARELLLAQSSDWPFMMADPNNARYGHERFRQHMANFTALLEQIRRDRIDKNRLLAIERQDNLFPDINLDHFSGS